MTRLLLPALLLALTACGQAPAPEGAATPPSAKTGATTAGSEARDPRVTLRAWADALEARDWAAAYALWGDNGKTSGMSAEAYAESYEQLKAIKIDIAEGHSEGAAGSLYYEADVKMTARTEDGIPVRFEGPVTLRRVNDVPGATPEDLEWHLVADALAPLTVSD